MNRLLRLDLLEILNVVDQRLLRQRQSRRLVVMLLLLLRLVQLLMLLLLLSHGRQLGALLQNGGHSLGS